MKDAQEISDIASYVTRTYNLSDNDKLALALELLDRVPQELRRKVVPDDNR